MKKFYIYLLFALVAMPVFAKENNNPFFGRHENQIGLYAGQSTGPGNMTKLIPLDWEYEQFLFANLQYSQPTDFFRLPARLNLHAILFLKHGDVDIRTQPAAGLSWDVALLHGRRVYLGVGLGGFIKPEYTHDRQDSLFMFGEKLFVGCRFSKHWSAEIYTQHFDSGGLTPINGGYNFVGLSVLWNF
ncbi:MAG: acyloxyacyl hydrolase [Alphaproteobacteria bacterium]|nr:acyloxyacyl hydrolase [Alphaproteobacteria bacterium]